MIYIGVTGKSGAGKTTFSNFWSTKSNVGVIHFDDLVDDVKKKYFKLFIVKKASEERTCKIKKWNKEKNI